VTAHRLVPCLASYAKSLAASVRNIFSVLSACLLCRVHIYEKTLPGFGGRSVVDGGLADSGAVLAHEIGHQLVRSQAAAAAGARSLFMLLIVIMWQ
jgi:hypothetical protein